MTTEEALQEWAEFISSTLKEYSSLMKDETMYELPSDLARAIDNAAIALGVVGELLVKYSPKRKAEDG